MLILIQYILFREISVEVHLLMFLRPNLTFPAIAFVLTSSDNRIYIEKMNAIPVSPCTNKFFDFYGMIRSTKTVKPMDFESADAKPQR